MRERALLAQRGRKDSWSHYVWDTNSITLSVSFSAKHFLKFISATGLTPADVHLYRESCPQERTNLRCERSLWHTCLLNKGDLGASQAEWKVQMRLWNPGLSYPSLIPIIQFQVIFKKKKNKLLGWWMHPHTGSVVHPNSMGTKAPMLWDLSLCTSSSGCPSVPFIIPLINWLMNQKGGVNEGQRVKKEESWRRQKFPLSSQRMKQSGRHKERQMKFYSTGYCF